MLEPPVVLLKQPFVRVVGEEVRPLAQLLPVALAGLARFGRARSAIA